MEKKEARSIALKVRKQNDKNLAKENVIKEIIDSKVLEDFNNIAIYYPLEEEISVMSLVSIYPEKCFYLPKTKEEEIYFVRYKLGDKLKNGPFHTIEPLCDEVVSKNQIECFIIPCVAISKDNRRIGYGKGYYDRYLEGYKGLKIGIAYQNTILDCDTDSYDILIDKIYMG